MFTGVLHVNDFGFENDRKNGVEYTWMRRKFHNVGLPAGKYDQMYPSIHIPHSFTKAIY
jgi:hypothetical protein